MTTEKKDKLTLKKYSKQLDKLYDMLIEVNDYYLESNITASDFIGVLETMKFSVLKSTLDRARFAHLESILQDAFGGDEDAD